MNYITVEGATKRYGDRLLFEEITFYINEGDKVAFIAKNGSGKTSLLNMIAGKERADGGKIWIHPKINVAYLGQDPNLAEGLTVFNAVYASENPVLTAIAAYEKSLENPDNQDALQKALSDMDRLGAWDYEVRIKQILSKLGVDYLDRKIGMLSGGQKKRVALAKVLIDDPDLLILDEPTNHLDLDMIEWLEQYLTQRKMTLFMVTHDRYFLDAVCNQILELNAQQIFKYQGDYSYYLQKKAEHDQNLQATTEKAQNLYRKELDWMRRQPKARGTKAKARIDKFFEIEKKAKRTVANDQVQLDIKMTRLGSKILELHNVSKSYDNKVFIKNFEYKFQKADRVGIVGRNGTGKSTLLNIMTKSLQPDSGKVVHGDTLEIGYYTQSGLKIKDDKRVIDIVRDIAEYIPMNGGRKLSASQLLERFLFDPKKQLTQAYKLSGGEKRRLHLLTILMKNPNFLILDEPTNDLDIMTLNVLEEFLMDFPGCVVIVSHDRHFMDKIVEHVFAFEQEGKIRDFPGNYTDYRTFSLQNKHTETKAKKPVKKEDPKKTASHEDRKALQRMERAIRKLEDKKKDLTAKFNDLSLDQDKIIELSKELKELEEKIEEMELEWMELAEKVEG